MKKIIALFSIVSVMSGCATVAQGVTEPVSIRTSPKQKLACNVKNSKGMWDVSTPGQIIVARSGSSLDINCERPDKTNISYQVKPHVSPYVIGNVIIGGIIGAAVDFSDGAAFAYPNDITIPLNDKVRKQLVEKEEQKRQESLTRHRHYKFHRV